MSSTKGLFPSSPEGGKENPSLGTASLVDGAASPPCKDDAAPTAATGGFPYPHRTVSRVDIDEMLAEGDRRFAQVARNVLRMLER